MCRVTTTPFKPTGESSSDQAQEDAVAELARLRSGVSIAAHELRNAAFVIAGFANILSTRRETLDDATLTRMLDSIVHQSRILDRQTRDLSAAAHLLQDTLLVEVEDVELAATIDTAISSQPAPTPTDVHCPAGLLVRADPVRLHQILDNLLSNAAKYAPGPREVVAEVAGGQVRLSVIDHGPGVPPAMDGVLFEQFARAESAKAAGTGLGLYVARALAEAQGGTIESSPTEGGGATFTVTLPLAGS